MMEWELRDRYLATIRMEDGGFVPTRVGVVAPIYEPAFDYFETLKEQCPHVHLSMTKNPDRAEENMKQDEWGCMWHYPGNYISGQVVGHPLSDWALWKDYKLPDPDAYHDWDELEKRVQEQREQGAVSKLGIEHGFFYLKMTYLRGFENFMMDVAERRPEAFEMADAICEFWVEIMKRLVALGPDVIHMGDDLGHQSSLPVSPASWRELIKPRLARILAPAVESGIETAFHTDGHVVPIIEDLIECGVTVLNPQDTVNGLDALARLAKGRVCIDLDIDRQNITYFGPPERIEQHIRDCVRTLGSERGGLMMVFGAYPGTPYENVGAVVRAAEECYDWWERNPS